MFFFLTCCSISFPLFAPLNSVIYVFVISMLFILLSCSKNFFYINIIKHGFFVLFNKQTQSSSTNPMLSQFPFMLHLRCANPLFFLKGFICFNCSYTAFILIYPHCFLLYPIYKLYWLRVILFSHATLTYTQRFQTLS